ncbi:MAG TPA: UDP-N-acetylglucosamine 2-epimerase, partial [Planctomycetota bacterium]|nr:UDP-N-acetylglucosamine 2-epimerase [Planctomycetota bacterium]
TDHLSRFLFCTSEAPVELLAKEGIRDNVHVVGDPMYDAVLRFSQCAADRTLPLAGAIAGRPFAVATIHRAENTDDPSRLRGILAGLSSLAREIAIVFPVHPRTEKTLERLGEDPRSRGIIVSEPLSYLDLHRLLRDASLVLTDSGGLQKEAFWHKVPCVTLRDTTEWRETIEAGWNTLAGADPHAIEMKARAALSDPPLGAPPAVYGDGRAGENIARILESSG